MSQTLHPDVPGSLYLFSMTLFTQMSGMTFGDIYAQRAHAFCGMGGTFLATTLSFPSLKNKKDRKSKLFNVALKIMAGGIVGLFFGELVVSEVCRYLERDMLGMHNRGISVALGFLSWYLLAGCLAFGKKLQNPELYRKLVAVIFNFDIPVSSTKKKKAARREEDEDEAEEDETGDEEEDAEQEEPPPPPNVTPPGTGTQGS